MQICSPALSLSPLFDFADSSRPRCARDEKGALSLARVPATGELAFALSGGAAFSCDWRRRSPPTLPPLPTRDNRAGRVSVPVPPSFWHHARLSLSRLRRSIVDASMLPPCLAPARPFLFLPGDLTTPPPRFTPIRGRGRARRGR